MWNIIGVLTRSSSLVVVTLFCLSFSLPTFADNNTDVTVSDSEQYVRPIDQGMEPLYVMTRTFLNLVQPLYKGHVLEIVSTGELLLTTEVELAFKLTCLHAAGRHWSWRLILV